MRPMARSEERREIDAQLNDVDVFPEDEYLWLEREWLDLDAGRWGQPRVSGRYVSGLCPLCFRMVVYRQRAPGGIVSTPHWRTDGARCRGVSILGITLCGPPLRVPLGELARQAA
jgi:hypothetical protein